MRLPLKKRGAEQYVSILSAAHKRKRIPPVIELTQYPASTPIIAWLARLRAAMTFAAVVCFILRYLTNVADAVRPIELQKIVTIGEGHQSEINQLLKKEKSVANKSMQCATPSHRNDGHRRKPEPKLSSLYRAG